MDARYIQRGDAIDYIPSTDIAAGDVIVIGISIVGVAKLDIEAGELGALALTGVYEIKKSPKAIFGVGDEVAWDIAMRRAVNIGTPGSIAMGHSVSIATLESPTALVRLCPGLK